VVPLPGAPAMPSLPEPVPELVTPQRDPDDSATERTAATGKVGLEGGFLAHYVTKAHLWWKELPVIVIERDGRTIVITGWRAWVAAVVAVVVTTVVLAALAFLVLGIAVSVIAFLLIVMPAVAIVVLMAWLFQARRR
jgi:hypothetical protein